MNVQKTDVLILGGGVIGLSCAYYLLQAGRSVTVLEQNTVGSGSSHGNCGTLTPSHAPPLAMPGMIVAALKCLFKPDAPLHIKPSLQPALMRWLLSFAKRCNWQDFERANRLKAPLLLRSVELIKELIRKENIECELETRGTLYVFRDPTELEQSLWLPNALRDVGIPIETWDGSRIEAVEPALKTGVVGGYFNPGDAHVRPDRYIAELARVVRSKGGVIEENTAVDRIEREEAKITKVHTTRGVYQAAEVVMALGAWSPILTKPLGIKLPMQPGKGYSITYSRPAICPSIPLVLKERSVCVTAWSSGYRLGSTMEFSGYDTQMNRMRLDALRRGAAEYLHEPEGPQTIEEWYGWRPMIPDDLPILGRVPNMDNCVLATGHGMLGVTMSAGTGLLISELITGRQPSLELEPFSIVRFG